jgi:hypothetical protein
MFLRMGLGFCCQAALSGGTVLVAGWLPAIAHR